MKEKPKSAPVEKGAGTRADRERDGITACMHKNIHGWIEEATAILTTPLYQIKPMIGWIS